MAKINWTAEAELWLKDIYEFIAQDNPKTAAKVVSSIYKKAQILKDFPEIGYKYKEDPEGDIRIFLYGHYRIAYLIRNKNIIDILGIFHGALDIERHLL